MASRPSAARLLDLIVAGVALWLAVQLVTTWAGRVAYPYDLEWMEGGMLAHAWRLQRGLPLYVEPGPEFVPFIYPPGYPALLGFFGSISGLTPALGRAISLLSAGAAAWALGFGVARYGGSRAIGALAAVVFLGSYHASGAFFDLVRPDALYVALLGWSIVLGLDDRRGAAEAAGLLLCAAFTVKHNAAAFGFALAIGIWVRSGWRQAARFGIASALPALLFTGYLQWLSEGRFLTYLLEVPSVHPMVEARVLPGTPAELGKWMWPAVVVGCVWLCTRTSAMLPALPAGLPYGAPAVAGALAAWWANGAKLPGGIAAVPHAVVLLTFFALGAAVATAAIGVIGAVAARRVSWRWVYGVGVATTAVVSAGLMRGHHGGFINVHMPMHWVVVFGFGIAVARVRLQWPGWGSASLTALALVGQLWWLGEISDLKRLVPTQADREAGDAVVDALRDCEDPVLSPYASWVPVYAGFEPGPHLISIWDINHRDGPFRSGMDALVQAGNRRYWSCVVEGGQRPLQYGIPDNYRERTKFPTGRAMVPKTGWRVRPTSLLVPKTPQSD